ncbi:hypothetical protein ACLBWT_05595 [Paenibacillus sp. D51F]
MKRIFPARDYLDRNSYEAAVAGNGLDGLKIIELLQPNYVILDLMLPDMKEAVLVKRIANMHQCLLLLA